MKENVDTDFAIANVQCQYEESDSSDRSTEQLSQQMEQLSQQFRTTHGIPEDHNYNSREPPAFVIQHVTQSHPSSMLTSVSGTGTGTGGVNLIRVDGTQIIQQPPQEYMFSKRVRRSETVLRAAADCVSRGLTFQHASEQYNIPISTIRFFMARKGILPRRKRGRAIQLDQGREVGQYCTSPEPPYHMQNYKLPNMVALNDDTS